MTTTLKKIVKVLVFILCLLLVGLLIKSITSVVLADKIKVKQDEFIYEYGTSISRELSDYSDSKASLINKAKFYFDVRNETGKDYPKVGTYTALIKFNDAITSFRVIVKDRVVPQFTNIPSSIEVPVGSSISDVQSYFSASDLSGATISVSGDTLNLNEVGSYNVVVTASDPYENMTSAECVVNVTARSGLANSGSYTDDKGNLVYFEEYYTQDEAVAAQTNKAADTTLSVSQVSQSTYNDLKVYRYEWYTKKVEIEVPTTGLADSGSETITDEATSQSVTASYESYFSQEEATAAYDKYKADTTLTVLDVATVTFNYQGKEINVYKVVWYTTPTKETPTPENPENSD